MYVDDTEGEETLVLDHMGQYGWKDALNKKKGLTLDFAKLVVSWMAGLHGLSHVLMKRYDAIHGKGAWLEANKWTESVTKNPPEAMKRFQETMRKRQQGSFLNMAKILQEEDGSTSIIHVIYVRVH